MTFMIGTFQSHCKREHNQSEIKSHGTCGNLTVLFYLQSSKLPK